MPNIEKRELTQPRRHATLSQSKPKLSIGSEQNGQNPEKLKE